jgi:hypothetical protein
VAIPHTPTVLPELALRRWSVHDDGTAVWIWYDSRGDLPWWVAPGQLWGPDWSVAETRSWDARAIDVQTATETAGIALRYSRLHTESAIPVLTDVHGTSNRFSLHVKWPDEGLDVELHGLGCISTTTPGARWLTTITPLDADTADVRLTLWTSSSVRDGGVAASVLRSAEADVSVWEHMQRAHRPVLADGNLDVRGRITEWSQQFYPTAQPASPAPARAGAK